MATIKCFALYRYQIIPIATAFQMKLTDTINYEQIISIKNRLFSEALLKQPLEYRGAEYVKTLNIIQEDKFLLRIGKEKPAKIYNEDFSPDHVGSFPPTTLIIDNDKTVQVMAVEKNMQFSNTEIPLKIILRALNKSLNENYLTIKYSPITLEKSFWDFVYEHEDKIEYVDFKLITPNMANISDVLTSQLKDSAKYTKASMTQLKFNAEKGASLNIDEENSDFNGLVSYVSRGGGNARIKAKNIKAVYDMKNSHLIIEADEVEVIEDTRTVIQKILEAIHGNIR